MKQYLKMADVFGAGEVTEQKLVVDSYELKSDSYGHVCVVNTSSRASLIAHAINSHDGLVQMNQELLAALEQCAKELAWMIDQHNEQYMEDGSWKYDHQTPWEAMQLVGKSKGGAE